MTVLFSAGASRGEEAPEAGIRAFSTGGHSVYHLRPATVDTASGRVLLCAAYDGAVLCCRQDTGERLWQARIGGFPFDLAVGDVDGDGLDECLVAAADGRLYAFDGDGTPLWTYAQAAPLYQVCLARTEEGAVCIATGGVAQGVAVLSADGRVLRERVLPHCVRHLRAGRITGAPGAQLAVATASSGLSGKLSLHLFELPDLAPLWTRTDLGLHSHNSGRRFFSMALFGADGTEGQDILLSHSWGDGARVTAFDGRGRERYSRADPKAVPRIPYRMNLLEPVESAEDRCVLDLFGNLLIEHAPDGTVRRVATAKYAFANLSFDPVTRRLFLGSSVSGGDGVYGLDLGVPGWFEAFGRIRAVGRLAEVEANLERLRQQVAAFVAPAYQPAPRPAMAVETFPPGRTFRSLATVRHLVLSQRPDDPEAFWCRRRDLRQAYDRSAEEIVALARERESAAEDFVIWSGHGVAVYMPLETMRAVLEAAPRHCRGFVFAELEQRDERMAALVRDILVPLAASCRAHGRAQIILRNKNIFYNGTCYLPFWREALLESGFGDVFLPSLEETNCRTQELSLAGRLGLWLSGRFEHWSCRAVTDNACFDRMWEWSSQQVLSHHLRHLVSRAALGADAFFLSVHQGPAGRALPRQLDVFFEMLDKGVLHIPRREELLSVSSVCLGMRAPPSARFLEHGANGHAMSFPRDDHAPMVFDRLDTYWGGAPVLEHDLSGIAFGVTRRMTNYLPTAPYGMIAIVPADGPASERFRRMVLTDGEAFFDAEGGRHGPAEYAPHVRALLEHAAAELPVRVTGEVHWVVSRLDPGHVRITLVDPGYVDPAERRATVLLQHLDGTACRDILSGEDLAVAAGRIEVTVPAGSLRILDLEHR
ncbi:MAG: PQQ-binding-like beta-propeller repeat protein [Lentisphaeria bacterium]|nr:PQQ-binding-like beta-propeller repeat protein [Lentisphaeria bacterium]